MAHRVPHILVLEREFDAPGPLVFEMFTKAEHVRHWWGPRGWDLPVCKVDFRPGGTWRYCMQCVDKTQGEFYGMESWGIAAYPDIVEPERIVYTDAFSDADGRANEEMPSTNVTLIFVDLGEKTRLVSACECASPEALK